MLLIISAVFLSVNASVAFSPYLSNLSALLYASCPESSFSRKTKSARGPEGQRGRRLTPILRVSPQASVFEPSSTGGVLPLSWFYSPFPRRPPPGRALLLLRSFAFSSPPGQAFAPSRRVCAGHKKRRTGKPVRLFFYLLFRRRCAPACGVGRRRGGSSRRPEAHCASPSAAGSLCGAELPPVSESACCWISLASSSSCGTTGGASVAPAPAAVCGFISLVVMAAR